ncbi:MAG: lysophospholipid acyltransferase family protein [Fibrobacterota bacterium]
MAKPFRRLRHSLAYHLVRLVTAAARSLPRPLLSAMAVPMGLTAALFLHRERRRAFINLRRVYPARSKAALLLQTAAVFINMVRTFTDSVQIPDYGDERFFRTVIMEGSAVKEAAARGRGVIALSGHLSAFELMTHCAQRYGIPCISVGTKIFDSRIEEIISTLRRRNGVEYIPRKRALPNIIRALKRGKTFGVLIDQDTTREGVFAPFLGKPAFTPSTTIKLALKYSVPIIYVAFYRDRRGRYHMESAHCPITPTGNLTRDILAIAADFNKFYEGYILEHPEQWVWIHRRWRKSPQEYPHIPVYDPATEEE